MALSETFFSSMQEAMQQAMQKIENEYREKFEEQENMIKKLEQKIDELSQYDAIDDILDEVELNEQTYQSSNLPNERKEETKDTDTDTEEDDKKKTAQFWSYLDTKLKIGDIEYIKDLVRNKEIKMDECNHAGRTLLMLATEIGSYELVSMAINLGADIDKEDNNKETALKIAKEKGFPDIEQLILMNMLKTELGERIENTTNDLLRKQGVTNNFNRILNELFQHSNDEKK
eukprot:340166_1